jgi:hypothetical protein
MRHSRKAAATLPALATDDPPYRRRHRDGPAALLHTEWRDPDDTNPNHRQARQINGYRTFCPLRRMFRLTGTQITERHILAADKLRTAIDAATIGFSAERDLSLSVTAIMFGPLLGPSRNALLQAQAWRTARRALGIFTDEQRRMLTHVLLENRTIQSWAQSYEPPRNQQVEMGKLLAIVEILTLHFEAEIDEDIKRGRGIVA